MKKNIHPNYKPLRIIMNSSEEFTTSSTYPGESFLLDVYFRKHHAWKGGVSNFNTNANQVAEFNKNFGSIFTIPSPN